MKKGILKSLRTGESEYGWMSLIQTKSPERSEDNRDDQKPIEIELRFLQERSWVVWMRAVPDTDGPEQPHCGGSRRKQEEIQCESVPAMFSYRQQGSNNTEGNKGILNVLKQQYSLSHHRPMCVNFKIWGVNFFLAVINTWLKGGRCWAPQVMQWDFSW